jgi:hypothetical protein
MSEKAGEALGQVRLFICRKEVNESRSTNLVFPVSFGTFPPPPFYGDSYAQLIISRHRREFTPFLFGKVS